MLTLLETEPLAAAALAAIRGGDVDTLRRLLAENAALSTATIHRPSSGRAPAFSYPLIGGATDWPGNFPRVATTLAVLVAAGADVDARCAGPHCETALHAAASADDLLALDALLDAGADIEAPGAVIAGGTPLDDAVAFSQWRAARRLVERGAHAHVWHAAALGLMDRVEDYFVSGMPAAKYPWGRVSTPRDELNVAFWCACHGGQRASAEYLLDRGAALSWVSPWDGLTPVDAARRSNANDVLEWLEARGGPSASG